MILSKEKNTSGYSSEDFIENPSLMKGLWHHLLKDDRNVHRTTSLFFEMKRAEVTHDPIFTLKDFDYTKDGITFYSLKKLYFSYDHIPEHEYQFALDVFGSWEHWNRITRCSIKSVFQEWRDELDIKIKAEAMRQMLAASRVDDARGIAAARYLADRGYVAGPSRKAGRPSKDEVARELKIEKQTHATLAADMERIGISVAK